MERMDGSCPLLLWPACFQTHKDRKETSRWASKLGELGELVLLAGGRRRRTNGVRGRKGGEKGKEQGTGCRVRKVDWGAWNTFFYFCGSAHVRESEFRLFWIVNVVILNAEPWFIPICGRKPDVAVLRALFDMYLLPLLVADTFLTWSTWPDTHMEWLMHILSFILKLGLGILLHLNLGCNPNWNLRLMG